MKLVILVAVMIAMLTVLGCARQRQTPVSTGISAPFPPPGQPPHGGYEMGRSPDGLMLGRTIGTCPLSMIDMTWMSLLEPAKRAGISQDQQAKLKKILDQNEQTKNALIDRSQKLNRQVRAAMLDKSFSMKRMDALLAESSNAEEALVRNGARIWREIRTVLNAEQAKAVLEVLLAPMSNPPPGVGSTPMEFPPPGGPW